MDLVVLMGAGLLGAGFLSSQIVSLRVSFIWNIVFGCGGGAAVWLALQALDNPLADVSLGSFLLLFVLGGFAGAFGVALFSLLRGLRKRS